MAWRYEMIERLPCPAQQGRVKLEIIFYYDSRLQEDSIRSFRRGGLLYALV